MVDSIKITALQDIGANIAYTTLVPVVNMAEIPTTKKANLQNLGNLVLNGAGGSYFPRAAQATLALSVANAAQPNITSVGTLNSLNVNGNVTTGNANLGNLVIANFFSGDGRFLTNVTASSSYNDSNVANYLPTYTGNIGGDVIIANLFSGNGSSLSAIVGANVSGFVPNANVANTAFAVEVANVSGLGNIATINLDGSTSNVLYGNGVFAPVSGGGASIGNVTFDDVTVQGVNRLQLSAGPDYTANLAYLQVRAGDVASHIHFDTGNSEAYDLIVGNDQKFVQVSSTGNILMSSYDGGTSYEWNMDNTGNLTLPGTINFTGGGIQQLQNNNLNIRVSDEENDGWSLENIIDDGLGNDLARTSLDSSSFNIRFGPSTWSFNNDNLRPPDNGSVGSFNSNIRIYAMNAGSNPVASLQSVSNVNDPNVFTTIDATTTGANIKVYNGGSNGGVEYAWQFSNDGNLTLPGNTVAINFANGSAAFGNIVVWTTAPVANISTGTVGQAAYDAGGNLYVCIATDTWTKFLGTTSW